MIPIPRSPRERALILERCRTDDQARQAVLEQCAWKPGLEGADACIFFINLALWTADPRADGSLEPVPLILYPFQEDLVRRLLTAIEVEHDDLLIEKSRAMGATIVLCAVAYWQWRFRPGTQVLLGSRNKDYVDDGVDNPKPLFGKLDFFIRHTPAWMLPPGFSMKRHRRELKLMNPHTGDSRTRGNMIRGEGCTGSFGRGDRVLWQLYDEACEWPEFAAAWRSGSSTTKTRVGNSTPKGMNQWGKTIHLPAMQKKRLTLHWRLHPKYDETWYKAECARIAIPEDIAQELDINYQLSQRGTVYPTWLSCEFGDFAYDPRHPLFCSWDFGLDMTAIIWWQRDPQSGVVTMLDCYQNRQRPIPFYLPFVTGEFDPASVHLKDYTAEEIAKITVHATWARATHFGDPSVRSRSVADGASPLDVFKRAGIYIHSRPDANDFKTRKRFTELGLAGLRVNLPDDGGPIGCWAVDDAMRRARFPERSPGAQFTSEVSRPVHDDSSHLRTAVEFYFTNLPPHRRNGRPTAAETKMAYDSII